VILAVVIALAGTIGTLIARGISRQLQAATELSRAIARGVLDSKVPAASRDEIGLLTQDMLTMRQSICDVLDAQNEMSRQHREGWISHCIDESRFAGEYATMVRGTNSLVGDHIATEMQAIGMVKRYATGDLSEQMQDLPNEKAAVSQAINGVRASLLAISTEIRQLSQAAAAGDFRCGATWAGSIRNLPSWWEI